MKATYRLQKPQRVRFDQYPRYPPDPDRQGPAGPLTVRLARGSGRPHSGAIDLRVKHAAIVRLAESDACHLYRRV